jgi:hypothetical protein
MSVLMSSMYPPTDFSGNAKPQCDPLRLPVNRRIRF